MFKIFELKVGYSIFTGFSVSRVGRLLCRWTSPPPTCLIPAAEEERPSRPTSGTKQTLDRAPANEHQTLHFNTACSRIIRAFVYCRPLYVSTVYAQGH